jgi:TPP-dependent indolepyruvate ferredoxin oxidoreductase alpha subunit
LAITKALLESRVLYAGGYQGAPVSRLLDMMAQAAPDMRELGVHVSADSLSNLSSSGGRCEALIVVDETMARAISTKHLIAEPAAFDHARLAHPPAAVGHESLKVVQRLPAARAFIQANGLNEFFSGRHGDVRLIAQGGLYNTLFRATQQLGLTDAFGASGLPILALKVTCPLLPDEIY